MLLRDVPVSPAYLVFHDCFERGAMDVWPRLTLAEAQLDASKKQTALDASGLEECGFWQAYNKLPHKKLHLYHSIKG
jgi:hypothetical protein